MAYKFFGDSFANFLSGLGMIGRDKTVSAIYVAPVLSREQLETAYKSDWIARKTIEIPAQDATRQWRQWQADKDVITQLEATEKKFQVQHKIQQVLIKARLYGGSALIIGADQGAWEEPLEPEKCKKDSLKFLHVVNRWDLNCGQRIWDVTSPWYGLPEWYERRIQAGVLPTQGNNANVRIHPSRVIRFQGLEPADEMIGNEPWGDPILMLLDDAVRAAGTVVGSIASLIAEAKVDIVKIPDMTKIISTDAGREKLITRFANANVAKSVVNSILLDKDEDWERIQVHFQGMPDILKMYLLVACAAADIPATRFIGQSPVGLNATGDSDTRNYNDRLKSDQEMKIQPALNVLDEVLIRTTMGERDESIYYDWRSLWQLTAVEKADLSYKKAQASEIDANIGLMPEAALAKARQNQLIEDGTYPGLETALQDAEKAGEVLPSQEEPVVPPGGVFGQPGNAPPKPAARPGAPRNDNARAKLAKKVGDAVAGGLAEYFDELLLSGVEPSEGDNIVPFGDFNEAHEPAGSSEGGRFASSSGSGGVSGSGQSRNISEFVSPNTSNISFDQAVTNIKSDTQKNLARISNLIDSKIGIKNSTNLNVIGAWSDGAENSLMQIETGATYDEAKLAAVMKGHLADQKQVLVFQPSTSGDQYLASFLADGDIGNIHEGLLSAGVAFHTLEPHSGYGNKTTVHVFGDDQKTLDAVGKVAESYNSRVEVIAGKGEFIGTTNTTGTDREQRDDAKKVYEGVITEIQTSGKLQGRDIGKIWDDVRNNWPTAAAEINPVTGKKKLSAEDFEKDKIGLPFANRKKEVDKFVEQWDKVVGVAPAEFKNQFLGGIDATMNIRTIDDGNIWEIKGSILKNGTAIGSYTREIDLERRTAESSYFKLNGSYTGAKGDKPYGKILLAGNVAVYQKMGIDTLKVYANIDVGGYAWAKYGYVPTRSSWDELSNLISRKLGSGSSSGGGSTMSLTPEEWAMVSESNRSDIKDHWVRDTRDEFQQSEVDSWRESGEALDQAKTNLAFEFERISTGRDHPEWAVDAIDELHDSRKESESKPIPYTTKQILDAVDLSYQEGYSGNGKFEVTFDDSMLAQPNTLPEGKQLNLPGIEPVKPSDALTNEMRAAIEKKIEKAFESKAESDANDIDPPDFSDSVEEYQREAWDNRSEREKFRWAENNGYLQDIEIENDDPEEDNTPVEASASVTDTLKKLAASSDPKALWAIADSEKGKQLLLGTNWYGEINLKDKQTMDRFNAYVGKAKNAKAA